MKRKRILCCTLIALNLALIFGNSAMPGSTSTGISDGFLSLLQGAIPGLGSLTSFLIRKLAHFSEFTCLGLLLGRMFRLLGFRGFPAFTSPAFFGILAACTDETIQYFVPGRDSNLIDVWIDVCGVFTGILFLFFGYFCIGRRSKQKKDKPSGGTL